MTLTEEIAAWAPERARPFAPLIASAAQENWPEAPRWFAWLLVAVGDRESGWRNVRGADGHGCGLLQVDDRAHASWCAQHDAFDPAQNIPQGANILAWGLRLFAASGRQAGVACYNCGPKNVRRGLALDPPNPDAFTTEGPTKQPDYGADVLSRLSRLQPKESAP